MISIINKLLKITGFSLKRNSPDSAFQTDYDDNHKEILNVVKPFTMTSSERIVSVIDAVRYISRHSIEGAVVECGVWRGGSMMAAALALKKNNATERTLYLYDTFEGMPPPEELDKDFQDQKAEALLKTDLKKKTVSKVWAYSAIDEVKKNLLRVNYPTDRIRFIKGKVEDTIPLHLPEKIALLRLDTDWYQSTKHELEHLYPLLVKGGVLIIDDYGFWKGARKAVDEYFESLNKPFFLHRIDNTGRIFIKN